MDEGRKIFADIEDEEEYERIQDLRRNDNFIVDDEGYGYKDHGGEIWEVDEDDIKNEDAAKNKKKRKLDVSSLSIMQTSYSQMSSRLQAL